MACMLTELAESPTYLPTYTCTILALKFRKSGQEPVRPPRWPSHDDHCTKACPGCLVCVVGALGPFPTCIVVNGSSENG